jgi:hypothetical protein
MPKHHDFEAGTIISFLPNRHVAFARPDSFDKDVLIPEHMIARAGLLGELQKHPGRLRVEFLAVDTPRGRRCTMVRPITATHTEGTEND